MNSTRTNEVAAVARAAAVTGGIALFAAATARARSKLVKPIEERCFRAYNDRTNTIHLPVWAVMQMGSLAGALGTAGAFGLAGRRRTAVAVATSGTAVWAGVKAVKPTVGRGRPARHLRDVRVRGQKQTGLGFPSGHTAVSLTVAIVGGRDLSREAKFALVVASTATAAARMYVGAHLPLDIVGGIGIGLAAGCGTLMILDWIDEREQEEQGTPAVLPPRNVSG
jgi:membrane-associated phospholipid phosphatase